MIPSPNIPIFFKFINYIECKYKIVYNIMGGLNKMKKC